MSFDNFPLSTRIWIYQSNREFSGDEMEALKKNADSFIKAWDSHGTKLRAGIEVVYNRFIIIGVDENVASASGCSIDKSVSFIREVEQVFNIDLFDRLQIAYKNADGTVSVVNLQEFETLLSEGDLNEETIVFNNLVPDLAHLHGQWELPVKKSWHSRLLPS